MITNNNSRGKNNYWLAGLLLGATLISGATLYPLVSPFVRIGPTEPPKVQTPIVPQFITALGRLEPETEIIHLAAPLELDGDRLFQLWVKVGDQVKQGQVIGVLESYHRLQASLLQAEEDIKVAQAQLAKVKAGAKAGQIQAQKNQIEQFKAELQGEILTQRATIESLQAQLNGEKLAQEATIRRIQAELANDRKDCQRYQMLHQEGVISAQEKERVCLEVQTGQANLSEAQANLTRIVTNLNAKINEAKAHLQKTIATLNQKIRENQANLQAIAEIRPVDVQVAQAELQKAIAARNKAKTELQQAYIRASVSGEVLGIRTHPGETINKQGIVELGQTKQMMAVAEVYQTDINKIRLGQTASVTSTSFPQILLGEVSEIGRQVIRQNVFSNQPGENLDRRVVEVKIKLTPKHSQLVAGLTNLQVQVAIKP